MTTTTTARNLLPHNFFRQINLEWSNLVQKLFSRNFSENIVKTHWSIRRFDKICHEVKGKKKEIKSKPTIMQWFFFFFGIIFKLTKYLFVFLRCNTDHCNFWCGWIIGCWYCTVWKLRNCLEISWNQNHIANRFHRIFFKWRWISIFFRTVILETF